jgi:hypothetical protein
MIIGIVGTIGSGKGEKRTPGASQDLEQFLRKVYRDCKSPVPVRGLKVLI